MPTTADGRRVLALASDRGSVQAIAPVVTALDRDRHADCVVAVPASSRDLFDRKAAFRELDRDALRAAPEERIRELFDRVAPRLLLSGSSPARGAPPETPEQYAVIEARRRGVPSLAILDYWGMYHERFGSRSGRAIPELVPDVIAALDERCASDLRAIGIPADRIAITHNPWLDRVLEDADQVPVESSANSPLVLVVLQPLAPIAPADVDAFWMMVVATIARALVCQTGPRKQILIWYHPALPPWPEEKLRELGGPVEAVATAARAAAVFRQADLLVTVHSTVAYEALHHGTPCVSLRIPPADFPLTAVDEARLTHVVRSLEELDSFVRGADPLLLRGELQARRRRLEGERAFFTDGQATSRCVRLARSLLDRPPRPITP